MLVSNGVKSNSGFLKNMVTAQGYNPIEDDKVFRCGEIEDILEAVSPILLKALRAYPKNLFLAGGSIVTFMKNGLDYLHDLRYSSGMDLDVFMVASSAEEAESITIGFAQILEEISPIEHYGYVFDPNCVLVHPEVVTWDFKRHPESPLKIQLVRRCYRERGLIPGGFDIWASQCMWSAGYGFECTLMGLYALRTGGFPVDCSKRSRSATHRYAKYVIEKNFILILPGLPHDATLPPILDADIFEMTQRFTSIQGFQITKFPRENIEYDYGAITHNDISDGSRWHQWFQGLKNRPIAVGVPKYSEISNITSSDVVRSMFPQFRMIDRHPRMYDMALLKHFFRTPEEWRHWSTLYYVDMEFEEAHRVWTKNLESYAEPVLLMYKDMTKLWKTKNPGEQRFGQNRPTPISARDYYGPTYIATYVGVHPDIYVVVRRWLRECEVVTSRVCPRDVVNLVMKYIIRSKEEDVLKALLASD